MADIERIVAALAATGLTVAEGRYEDDSADRGPHIVVRHEGARALSMNGRTQAVADDWSASLYSQRWEPSLEDSVEAALADAGITHGGSMSGYDDEHGVHWTEWDFQTPRQSEDYED